MSVTARLSDLVSDVLFTSARITGVTDLSARFVLVELSADAFRRAKWLPGDKLQLRPQRGSLQMRAYTPIGWNRETGTTEVIGFRHGDGPAVRWFGEAAVVGADCEVFGPSRSLDLSETGIDSTVFVGDETSVGLARALHPTNPTVRYVYEAVDPDALSETLAALSIVENVEVIRKSDDRGLLLDHIVNASGELATWHDLVITGDAATVSAVRRGLRRWPNLAPRIKARAYWAQGRTGLS